MAELTPQGEASAGSGAGLQEIRGQADRQRAVVGDTVGEIDTTALLRFSPDLPETLEPSRRAELVARIEALEPWLQGPFLLADDLVIPGRWRNDLRWDLLDATIPELVGDLESKRVLDVGSNAGYDPFMFAQRGAHYVLACEPFEFVEQARLLESIYGTGIDLRRLGWQELHPEHHGLFDIVHCHGVLYHEPHPSALLQRLRLMMVDGGDLLFGSMMLASPEQSAHARFVPDAYAEDPTWWWVPGRLAMRWMLEAAGFELVRELPVHEGPRGEFGVVNGYFHVRAGQFDAGLGLEPPSAPRSRFPAGHYYSPMYDTRELEEDRGRVFPDEPRANPGIDWNDAAQLEFCARALAEQELQSLAPEPTPDPTDYFASNDQFPPLDAWALDGLLRHLRPRRMIEIGSGFSSLVAARTNREALDEAMTLTCVEPYPRDFLTAGVPGISELRTEKVQETPLEVFTALEAGDVLFVDTSHTVKTGGDVVWIFQEIIPRVAPGVHVHIHDVFLPGDYPEDWVMNGWGWNESYLVAAFLSFNAEFEVVWGAQYMLQRHEDTVLTALPGMREHLHRQGGSLWIRRRDAGS